MTASRREFIKRLGIAFGSLMVTRCTSVGRDYSGPGAAQVTCYTVEPLDTPTLDPSLGQRAQVLTSTVQSGDLDPATTRRAQAALGRERVRRCWASLDELSEQTKQDPANSQDARDSLSSDHRAALDDLIGLGELGAPVAAQVQAAFEEAAYHVWRSFAATCYEPVEAPLHQATVRGDLMMVQQRLLLEDTEDLDPETVARAQSAIARDIAVLGIWRAEGSVDERIAELWKSGEYEASAEDVEAARFLVELLLEP
ncbi:MAG: hypothetical protein ISS56_10930 [Anaerolineae bacterium]|nr:hypothetical protein [Anaerolineae bacterium]